MTFLSQFAPYKFPLLGLVRLPQILIEPEAKKALGLRVNASNTAYLKSLAWNGYLAKVKSGQFVDFTEQEVKERLQMEFTVFEKTGIIDYLLLVWDILTWCDKEGIARGPGRGSVCGSLSCYFLGITKINSLKHQLNFTRFLSEARAKPKIVDGVIYADGKNLCDIDSDISFVDRPRVIQYVEQRHAGKTSKISTRLQLTGKTALKDVLKAYLSYNETQAKSVTDSIEAIFGKVEDLDKAIDKHKELKDWTAERPENHRAYAIARMIEGLNLGKGQHPSGVFISYSPLDGNIPTELAKTKDVVTSYDMNVAATLGIKIDLLGLRSTDLITEACRLAGIRDEDIDVNHPSVYEYLGISDLYYGLFQVEDGLTKQVVQRVKPKNVDSLAACLALSRPGSLRFIDDFVKFSLEGVFKPIFPAIDAILKTTGNILLYQEQINRICQEVYGMSAVDSDEVRRAIGKKIKEDMAKWEPVLYANGKDRGIPEDVTKYFWDVCNASADYLFSVNHSTAYAYITAQTAYLKANYPREFIFALLKLSKHEPDSQTVLNGIIGEAKQIGVKILPPDIIKSQDDFSIEDDGIRFGLSHIRGISDTTMKKLVSFRRDFATKCEIFNAAAEAKISIAVLAGIIYCGALDTRGGKRSRLALEAQAYNELTPREQQLVQKLAPDYNDDILMTIRGLKERVDEKGKPYIKDSRWETFQKNYGPFKQMYEQNSRSEEILAYHAERNYLGFSYSNTLHNLYSSRIHDLMTVAQVLAAPDKSTVKFIAFIDELKSAESKKSKKPYLKYEMSDETGKIKVMIHGEESIEAVKQFHGEIPKEGAVVCVTGSKGSADMIFSSPGRKQWKSESTESFVVQPIRVCFTKSDLVVDI